MSSERVGLEVIVFETGAEDPLMGGKVGAVGMGTPLPPLAGALEAPNIGLVVDPGTPVLVGIEGVPVPTPFAGGGVVPGGNVPVPPFTGGDVVPGGKVPVPPFAGGGVVQSS